MTRTLAGVLSSASSRFMPPMSFWKRSRMTATGVDSSPISSPKLATVL